MEVRDRNLLEVLLKSEFDRARRHKLHLSCIMLKLCDLEDADSKQDVSSLDFIINESIKLLSETVRSSDIVASYNKEKFLVVLPMVSAHSTTCVAQRVWRIFKDYFYFKGTTANIPPMCMGISSIFDQDINSPVDLIRCAETALNRALSKGENAICLWKDLA